MDVLSRGRLAAPTPGAEGWLQAAGRDWQCLGPGKPLLLFFSKKILFLKKISNSS